MAGTLPARAWFSELRGPPGQLPRQVRQGGEGPLCPRGCGRNSMGSGARQSWDGSSPPWLCVFGNSEMSLSLGFPIHKMGPYYSP